MVEAPLIIVKNASRGSEREFYEDYGSGDVPFLLFRTSFCPTSFLKLSYLHMLDGIGGAANRGATYNGRESLQLLLYGYERLSEHFYLLDKLLEIW